MQIKSFIIDNIHYIPFITFNISTLFFSWFAQLKLEFYSLVSLIWRQTRQVVNYQLKNILCLFQFSFWISCFLFYYLLQPDQLSQ